MYAQKRVKKFNYSNLFIIKGDGGEGYPLHAPYDKICMTVACREIPPPLIAQLKEGGKLITPRGSAKTTQDLILLEKGEEGSIKTKIIEKVLYVALQGKYAHKKIL